MGKDTISNAEKMAVRLRDRRLRRLALEVIDQQKISQDDGWASGRLVMDCVSSQVAAPDAPETDERFLALLRDLVIKGYAEEEDARTHKTQVFGLDFLRYRITGVGISLVNCSVAPDPDIADDRPSTN
jgi:hypothetical protein